MPPILQITKLHQSLF